MPEPMETRIPLPPGGCWPLALLRIELPPELHLDQAIFELAGTSRRLRQGVKALFHGRDLVVFPDDRVDEVARAWVKRFRNESSRVTGAPPAPSDPPRWTPKRKAAVVAAIAEGSLGFTEALRAHSISADELATWILRAADFGREGLKATKLRLVDGIGRKP